MWCRYCEKIFNNRGGLAQHEKTCRSRRWHVQADEEIRKRFQLAKSSKDSLYEQNLPPTAKRKKTEDNAADLAPVAGNGTGSVAPISSSVSAAAIARENFVPTLSETFETDDNPQHNSSYELESGLFSLRAHMDNLPEPGSYPVRPNVDPDDPYPNETTREFAAIRAQFSLTNACATQILKWGRRISERKPDKKDIPANAAKLRSIESSLPDLFTEALVFRDPDLYFAFRPALDIVSELLSKLSPWKGQNTHDSAGGRCYGSVPTGQAWAEAEAFLKAVNINGIIVGIMIYADSTTVTQFRDRSMHPVYLRIFTSSGISLWKLCGFLPSLANAEKLTVGTSIDAATLRAYLYHYCFTHLMVSVDRIQSTGFVFNNELHYPTLFLVSGDTPEMSTVSLTLRGRCRHCFGKGPLHTSLRDPQTNYPALVSHALNGCNDSKKQASSLGLRLLRSAFCRQRFYDPFISTPTDDMHILWIGAGSDLFKGMQKILTGHYGSKVAVEAHLDEVYDSLSRHVRDGMDFRKNQSSSACGPMLKHADKIAARSFLLPLALESFQKTDGLNISQRSLLSIRVFNLMTALLRRSSFTESLLKLIGQAAYIAELFFHKEIAPALEWDEDKKEIYYRFRHITTDIAYFGALEHYSTREGEKRHPIDVKAPFKRSSRRLGLVGLREFIRTVSVRQSHQKMFPATSKSASSSSVEADAPARLRGKFNFLPLPTALRQIPVSLASIPDLQPKIMELFSHKDPLQTYVSLHATMSSLKACHEADKENPIYAAKTELVFVHFEDNVILPAFVHVLLAVRQFAGNHYELALVNWLEWTGSYFAGFAQLNQTTEWSLIPAKLISRRCDYYNVARTIHIRDSSHDEDELRQILSQFAEELQASPSKIEGYLPPIWPAQDPLPPVPVFPDLRGEGYKTRRAQSASSSYATRANAIKSTSGLLFRPRSFCSLPITKSDFDSIGEILSSNMLKSRLISFLITARLAGTSVVIGPEHIHLWSHINEHPYRFENIAKEVLNKAQLLVIPTKQAADSHWILIWAIKQDQLFTFSFIDPTNIRPAVPVALLDKLVLAIRAVMPTAKFGGTVYVPHATNPAIHQVANAKDAGIALCVIVKDIVTHRLGLLEDPARFSTEAFSLMPTRIHGESEAMRNFCLSLDPVM